jgi:superfamily II DNA/RNA helicase
MTSTFASLGIRTELVESLAKRGIATPFDIQSLTIRDAIAGRDVCGQAKTGSGKTLAFGLPLLQRLSEGEHTRHPRGLVLVPTRELASQVVDDLTPLGAAVGITVLAVYGGVSLGTQGDRLAKGIDIIVATPGRLVDLIERKLTALDDVQIAIVDEADRMSDIGFLPPVDWLLRQMRSHRPQTLLFSATLDSVVDQLVQRHLADPVRFTVQSTDDRVEEMTHRFLAVHPMDRVKVAAAIARTVDRTIVFTRTKRGADRVAQELSDEGLETSAIHGDLAQPVRERALKRFSDGKIKVLVATDVAARGIHVDDIDIVIHFDPPADHKDYLHRSGRTARAGRTGIVATFVLWDQKTEVDRLKKRLGLDQEPTVTVYSTDSRLADLESMHEDSASVS